MNIKEQILAKLEEADKLVEEAFITDEEIREFNERFDAAERRKREIAERALRQVLAQAS